MTVFKELAPTKPSPKAIYTSPMPNASPFADLEAGHGLPTPKPWEVDLLDQAANLHTFLLQIPTSDKFGDPDQLYRALCRIPAVDSPADPLLMEHASKMARIWRCVHAYHVDQHALALSKLNEAASGFCQTARYGNGPHRRYETARTVCILVSVLGLLVFTTWWIRPQSLLGLFSLWFVVVVCGTGVAVACVGA